jgi:hypothetical protein
MADPFKKTIQKTTPDRLTEADLLGLIYGLTPFSSAGQSWAWDSLEPKPAR